MILTNRRRRMDRRVARRTPRTTGAIESLENRCMLAGTNQFALYAGSVAPGNAATIPLTIATDRFTLAGGAVSLGFHVRSVGDIALDPAPLTIRRADNSVVPLSLSVDNVGDSKDSLAIASLSAGIYTLTVAGTNNSFGDYLVETYLLGDVDSDGSVSAADAAAFSSAYGAGADRDAYQIEADANLDGTVGLADLMLLQNNLGASTNVEPLFLSSEIDPTPIELDDGTLATNVTTHHVVGITTPHANVSLQLDSDGLFNDGSITTGDDGMFSLPATLVQGLRSVRVRAMDAFGQQQLDEFTVRVDALAPTTPTFHLSSDSDTGAIDNQTTARFASLVGVTEPGAIVSLDGTDVLTVAAADGSFTLDNVPLSIGDNHLTIRAVDVAENASTYAGTVTRLTPAETDPPRINWNLLIDTGRGLGESDRYTSVGGIAIALIENSAVSRLSFNGPNGTELVSRLNEFNFFTLDRDELEGVLGHPLVEGLNTLTLTAVDEWGNRSDSPLSFRLDTIAPGEPTYTLDPAFDTGTLGDRETTAPFIRIEGYVDPSAQVRLDEYDLWTRADMSGHYSFAHVPLHYAVNFPTVTVFDAAGNSTSWYDEFYRPIPATDTAGPDLHAWLSGPTIFEGQTARTNAPYVGILAFDLTDVVRLDARFTGAPVGGATSVLGDLQPNGFVWLDEARLASIYGGALADGDYSLVVEAQDSLGHVSQQTLSFAVDRTGAAIEVTTLSDGGIVRPNMRLQGAATTTGAPLVDLEYQWEQRPAAKLSFDTGGSFLNSLSLAGLTPGPQTLTIRALDAAGNRTELVYHVTVSAEPLYDFFVTQTSPQDGALDVAPTSQVRVDFTQAFNPATLTSNSFYAKVNGAKLPATIVASNDRMSAWLYFTSPLPGGAAIDVTLESNLVRNAQNTGLVTADDAMNLATFRFYTSATAPVAGTSLTGRLVGPGPDGIPRTADDYSTGADHLPGTADDIYLAPVAGAQVTIVGRESAETTTDANGQFTLDNVPAGGVQVFVDGWTAGANIGYYARTYLPVTLEAGEANTLSATGAPVYLADITNAHWTFFDATHPARMPLVDDAAGDLAADERPWMWLDIAANSLVDAAGAPVAEAWSGIAVLPPAVLRQIMPAGPLQDAFGFMVESDFFSHFSQSPSLTLPNVFDQAPGTTMTLVSQDRTSGAIVPIGTATVSADGTHLTSNNDLKLLDPGVVALAPAGAFFGTQWFSDASELEPFVEPSIIPTEAPFFIPAFGPQPEGSPGVPDFCRFTGDGMAPPHGAPKVGGSFALEQTSKRGGNLLSQIFPEKEGLIDHIFFEDGGSIEWKFTASPQAKTHPYQDCYDYQPAEVKIEYDQKSFDPFLTSTIKSGDTFSLGLNNTSKTVTIKFKDLKSKIKDFDHDQLYGTKIKIYAKYYNEKTWGKPVEISLYRLLDTADKEHQDGKISMPKAAPGLTQTRKVDIHLGPGVSPLVAEMKGSKPKYFTGQFSATAGSFTFKPSGPAYHDDMSGDGAAATIRWKTPSGAYFKEELQIEGDSRAQILRLDVAKLLSTAAKLAGDVISPLPDTQPIANLSAGVADFITSAPFVPRLITQVRALLAPAGKSIQLQNGPCSSGFDGVCIDVWDTAHTRDHETRGSGVFGVAIDSDGDLDKISDARISQVLADLGTKNRGQVAYELSQSVNKDYSEVVDIYLDNVLVQYGPTTPRTFADFGQLINALAKNIVHETGHTLGLRHTAGVVNGDVFVAIKGDNGADPIDMMGQGADLAGKQRFRLTLGLMKMGVGAGWTENDFDKIETYLTALKDRELKSWKWADAEPGATGVDHNVPTEEPQYEGFTALLDPAAVGTEDEIVLGTVAFGAVVGAGDGAPIVSRAYHLTNLGDLPVVVSGLATTGGQFYVAPFGAPVTLQAGQSLPVVISVNATHTGDIAGQLIVTSDANLSVANVSLTASVVSPTGDIRLDVPNNNFGGALVSAAAVASEDFATIRNVGLGSLTVTGVQILGGNGQFTVERLPVGFGPGSPIVVAPGGALPLNLAFNPSAVGLQNAKLVIQTNDPGTPVINVTLVGTGLSDDGAALSRYRNYVALQVNEADGDATYHTRTDALGHWNLFVGAENPFTLAIFDAASGLLFRDVNTMPQSGTPLLSIAEGQFAASTDPDTDGDGLPDDIEFALGTRADSIDSDGDGVTDFDEFDLGPPAPAPVSPAPLVPLAYNANNFAVSVTAVDGPTAADHTVAYVGAYKGGVGVYDLNNPAAPVLLGAVPISGFVLAADADPTTQTLAVAGETGLHILSIADPAHPSLVRTIVTGAGGAQFVALHGGMAYVTAGNDVVGYTLQKIDPSSGSVLQSIALNTPGTPRNVTGFVRDGNFLYTMNRIDNILRIFDISGPTMVLRGSLTLNGGSGGLAVRNGIAYVGNTYRLDNIFATAWGYSTVNVADPDHPTLIASLIDAPNPQVPGQAIVVSDAGMAVMSGTIGATFTGLKVVNVSNPSASVVTNTFTRTFAPQITALGDGRVLAPSLQNGLEAIDFLPADTAGTNPVATLTTNAVDVNPGKPGIQIYEGTLVRIDVTSVDNSLTRSVDLLSNGQAIVRDAAPPYDEFALTAAAVGPSGALWTLQARATDRFGNVGLSAITTLEIVPIAPRVAAAFPAPSEQTHQVVDALSVTFSEAMNTTLLDTADIALVGAGADNAFGTADDQTIAITAIEPTADARTMRFVLPAALAPGRYRFTLDDQWFRDLSGNLLDGEVNAALPSGNGAASGDFVDVFTVLAPPTMPGSHFAGEYYPLYPFQPRYIDNYSKPVGPLLSGDVTGDGLVDAVQLVAQTLLVANGGGSSETVSVFVAVLPGLSDGGFGSPILSRVATDAQQIALGDADRDGLLDLFVAGVAAPTSASPTHDARLLLYHGGADGVFSQETVLASAPNLQGVDGLVVGDLTGDSVLDAAFLAHGSGFNFVADFTGDGFGEFALRNVNVLSGNQGDARLWTSDVNSDGRADLITDRRLLVGSGTSYVESFPVAAGQAIRGVANFSGDGKTDLLVERIESSNNHYMVRILEGAAGGAWTARPEFDVGTSAIAATYVAADFTGDGRADFAVGTNGPSFSGGELLQVASSATGVFTELSRRVIGFLPDALAAATLAGDANRDLLASIHYTGLADGAAIAVFAGTATGKVETSRTSGPNLEYISVGDFNGDTKPDRVGYDAQVPAHNLYLELGAADGTFGNPTTISTWSANFEPSAPIVADVNKDGKLDLVAASGAGGASTYYFRGRGDGTFDPPVFLLGGVDNVSLADLNGDARLDAIYKSSYRLQNVDGTFAAAVNLTVPSSITGTTAWGVADVTGDGRPDIVAASANNIATFVNQPGLTFTAVVTTGLLDDFAAPRRLTLGDVNGDGRADVTVIKFNDEPPQLLLASGGGVFRAGVSLASIGSASDAAIADVNGDTLADIVFSTSFGVEAILGNGDGTFVAGQRRHLARRTQRVVVADIDKDGLLDILSANFVLRQR